MDGSRNQLGWKSRTGFALLHVVVMYLGARAAVLGKKHEETRQGNKEVAEVRDAIGKAATKQRHPAGSQFGDTMPRRSV